MNRISFYDEIKRNKRQSFFLVFFVLIVLLALVYVISLALDPSYTYIILFFGTILSVFYTFFGYYNSHKLAILSVNAKPADGAEYRQYHNIVEGICLASGIPKPKLYVMHNSQINAFASGRNPKNAVVCVTTGALQKLNKHELEGVLAHEISHIANYDIRFMTLAAVLIGMISIIAQMFLRSLWYSGNSNSENSKGKMIFLIIGIILAIIAPIVTLLVQLAISRRREYAADSSAVKFMRTPTGLINALEKIKSNEPMKVSGAVAPLFLAKPNKTKEIFMTHPPLEKRIAKLKLM